MKTVGIIAEYNPFHNGHLYQLKKAKELSGADFVVVIMSGNFVQRGVPAFIDKFSRADMALSCGADLVIELPVRYATASAEFFAFGAISLLENLGINSVCFGSECGDIESLQTIAHYIQKDCDEFNNRIVKYVKRGFSYPVARKEALIHCMKDKNKKELQTILESPNNILAIEYLKSLSFLNSQMTPYTIKRVCTGYHEKQLQEKDERNVIINSATAIRESLSIGSTLETIKNSMPENAFEILSHMEKRTFPIQAEHISNFLFYKLWESTLDELSMYLDVSNDLARTIWNAKNEYTTFSEFGQLLKSKQITQTRINRALLHILLGIKDFSLKDKNAREIAPYGRVLGFNRKASVILKQAKEREYPVITKMANAKDMSDENALILLDEDVKATELYKRMVYQQFGVKLPNDFLRTPTVI